MADLIQALGGAVDRARADRRQREVRICDVGTCTQPAQPEHTPCCRAIHHVKALCCRHYCRTHFVEVDQCSPESHAAVTA